MLVLKWPEVQGLLGAFVDYIKERKTVGLEELAAEFGLRVQVSLEYVSHLHVFVWYLLRCAPALLFLVVSR